MTPPLFRVRLAARVERDLAEIYDYITLEATPARAAKVLERLRRDVLNLAKEPERGSWPAELAALGMHELRQLISPPYRVIYEVTGLRVTVLLIVDTRRNLVPLLQRRLLNP